MELRAMDIIVTRTKSPVSWWIRRKSNSDWSHVCLAGLDGTLFTTTATGYKLLNAEKYLKGKTFAVYRMEGLDAIRADAGLYFNRKILGTPYAWSDVFQLWLQNWKGHGIKKVRKNSKNYFCAEAVAETYDYMGKRLLPHLDLEPSGFLPHRCIEDARLKRVVK